MMRSSDILIVDDEVGIRELLSEILQDEGYTVALAENAEVARQPGALLGVRVEHDQVGAGHAAARRHQRGIHPAGAHVGVG